MLLQGVEVGVIKVPLHLIHLCSDIISGTVTVGFQPSLPVKGVSMILGNDLAGDRVIGEPQVFEAPCFNDTEKPSAHLYLSCAVTRVMSKAAVKASQKNNQAVNDNCVTPFLVNPGT